MPRQSRKSSNTGIYHVMRRPENRPLIYAKATPVSSITYDFAFFYYNQDHLGNIRVVEGQKGNVQQLTNYYPFGAPFVESSSYYKPDYQPYKYNGKELDLMHGLNTYDYGARQYDPILAKWDRVDRMTEKKPWQGPYVYGRNNPLRFVDPDGNDEWDKLQGLGRGFLSNIIPGTSLRDSYTPNNSADYNAGLKSADRTSIVIGSALIADGGRNVAAGIGGASASAAVTAVSGGAAAPVTVVTGGGSLVLTVVGAAEGGIGAMMLYNTSKNSSEGYSRESKLSPNQANKAIIQKKAPKGIARVHKAHQPGGQDHVHLKNGRGAINADGSGHDGPKPKLTKKETDFISMIEGFFK